MFKGIKAVFKSLCFISVLASTLAASFLLLILSLVAPPNQSLVEISKISITSTVTIIGLSLIAITYAKGVLSTKYFALEASELEEQVSSYVVDVIDFFEGKVTPLIRSSEEWKATKAKIENLKSLFTNAIRSFGKNRDNADSLFNVLHEADTKILMIEFIDLFHRHEDENLERWSKLLEERNKLHEQHFPLIKRLSNFQEIQRIISPRFLLVMALGFIEIVLALTTILSINALPARWIYVAYAFQFFILFYVFVATVESLWKFMKW